MDWFETAFYATMIVFILFALIGMVDVVFLVVMWRWRVVKKNSAKRALNGKTIEIILIPWKKYEEMDRFYGGPW